MSVHQASPAGSVHQWSGVKKPQSGLHLMFPTFKRSEAEKNSTKPYKQNVLLPISQRSGTTASLLVFPCDQPILQIVVILLIEL